VLRVKRHGEPYLLLVRDERWGDLTLVGGHEEPSDGRDLDVTARREACEELGSICSGTKLQPFPLTNEIVFGPTWSKSAAVYKKYNFKFYGARFDEQPDIKEGWNEAGFWLTLVKQSSLGKRSNLSNVVKLLLASF
jgi:hypothetical protein